MKCIKMLFVELFLSFLVIIPKCILLIAIFDLIGAVVFMTKTWDVRFIHIAISCILIFLGGIMEFLNADEFFLITKEELVNRVFITFIMVGIVPLFFLFSH